MAADDARRLSLLSAAELATPAARGRASLPAGGPASAPPTAPLGGAATPATAAVPAARGPRSAKVDLGEGFTIPLADLERLERRQQERRAAADPAARSAAERRRHLAHLGKTFDFVMALFEAAPAVRPHDDVVAHIERQFAWKNPISRADAHRRLELLVEAAAGVVGGCVTVEDDRGSGGRVVRVDRARAYEHEVRRRLLEVAGHR